MTQMNTPVCGFVPDVSPEPKLRILIWGDTVQYQNLIDLVRSSSSARRYFFSLPVELQLAMSEHGEYIRTAAELRNRADAVAAMRRHDMIGGWEK